MNNLPRELIGEICNSLDITDVVELGKTNRQFNTNLSKIDFGYKIYRPVNIETIFNDIGCYYIRKQFVVGHFKHFIVRRLDNPLNLQTLWSCLTHLTFGTYFNQSVDNLKLPKSLTHLTFGDNFNQSVDNLKLPESLTHLTFGTCFDKSVDNLNLPKSLTHLSFGSDFNQPIEGLMMSHLKSLTLLSFGCHFNQPVYNMKLALDGMLTHLIFGSRFDQSLMTLKLPRSLIILALGYSFRQPIDNIKLPTKCVIVKTEEYSYMIERLRRVVHIN